MNSNLALLNGEYCEQLSRSQIRNELVALAQASCRPTLGLESLDDSNKPKSIQEAMIVGTDGTEATLRMVKAIIQFSKEMKARTDHQSFFGGNLLGVDQIRFYTTDRDRWFDDVLQIDEEYLRETVHDLDIINTDWVVTSDVFNLSCIWVVNLIYKKFGFGNKLAMEAMIETLIMMQFRFLTSIYAHYFRKPVDNDAAEATYASLTMKFKIRQLGTWGAVLKDRAELFLAKDSIHLEAITKLTPDEAVLYFITDMSTRTRKLIKDQYAVLDKIRSGNLRIQTTNSSIVLDGDKIIRDRVNSYSVARAYLYDVSGNPASFIKQDLVNVVLNIMNTVSEQNFKDLLVAASSLPTGPKRDNLEWMLDNTLLFSFDYIQTNRIRFNDIQTILIKMRAKFMSSKSQEPVLLELRSRIEEFCEHNSKLKSPAALASARTSMMLYFLLRALSSNRFR